MNTEPKESAPEWPKRIVPEHCVCAHKWDSKHVEEIHPVCDEYVRWRKDDARCANCEHDEACHR